MQSHEKALMCRLNEVLQDMVLQRIDTTVQFLTNSEVKWATVQ